MEYHTAGGTDGNELDETVNAWISREFQPFGNPYVVSGVPLSDGGKPETIILQAMVKYD